MRVLVVAACPFPWPRGTPVRIHRLSEALVARGHELDVVTYPIGDRHQTLPFPVIRVPDPGYYRKTQPGPSVTKVLVFNPWLVRKVIQRYRELPFAILHAHHIEGLLVALLARKLGRLPVPIIYDAHTAIGEELGQYGPALFRGLAHRVGEWLDQLPPSLADHIITVTDDLKELFQNPGRYSVPPISVISNGLEEDFIHRARSHQRRVVSERLVFAGNLAAYQGLEALLSAFARVHSARPEAELHLLTDDDFSAYRPTCQALGIMDAVKVRPCGLTELPGELAEAGVLLNPRMECSGIPQKLLNYMASGRPIVSFAGSAKVISSEREGLVVPNGDIDGFAQAVLRVMTDPVLSHQLGEAARDRVQQSYTWSAAARQVETVFESALTKYNANSNRYRS